MFNSTLLKGKICPSQSFQIPPKMLRLIINNTLHANIHPPNLVDFPQYWYPRKTLIIMQWGYSYGKLKSYEILLKIRLGLSPHHIN